MIDRLGLHFLVAEDDPMNRALMAAYIELIGGSATMVDNGLAALNSVTTNHFNGLIVDLNMPGASGVAVLQAVRKRPGPNQTVPAMLWTASSPTFGLAADIDAISNVQIAWKPLGLRDFVLWVNQYVSDDASVLTPPITARR